MTFSFHCQNLKVVFVLGILETAAHQQLTALVSRSNSRRRSDKGLVTQLVSAVQHRAVGTSSESSASLNVAGGQKSYKLAMPQKIVRRSNKNLLILAANGLILSQKCEMRETSKK